MHNRTALLSFLLIFCFWIFAEATIQQPEACYPDQCVDPDIDTFFSYNTCCDTECCNRLRYWVYPASIAGIGFIAGAFFALCFQCR